MKTLSKSNRQFFTYSFSGNGKYYTNEAKSRTYGNTLFQNFYNKNSECIDILESGNDAPRGGKTGDFVIVNFNEKFFEKWGYVLEAMAKEKQEKQNFEANKESNKAASKAAILEFIKENQGLVNEKKSELDSLKAAGNKDVWQIKANALVQMVSKNDFSLGWKEIYTLIKNN